jgi:hypothetical protein
MLTNEIKKSIKINQRAIKAAKENLLYRVEDVDRCFESSIKLLRAALNMCLQDELGGQDLDALGELLMLCENSLNAGFSHYLIERAEKS